MGNIGYTELILILFVFVIPVWFGWRICEKAGYPGALALLLLVPLANLVLIGILAFGDWPIHRQMREAGLTPPGV